MDEIVPAYRAATRRSEELAERFQRVLPGGETRSGTFLLVHGVYAASRGMPNLSTALSNTDFEAVAGAYDAAIAGVVRAGLVPPTLTAQTPA